MSRENRASKEFDKNKILLSLRKACDPQCYEAITEIHKREKGKKTAVKVKCTKMEVVDGVSKCELFLNPCQMWAIGQCIYPNSALCIQDATKQNYKKHRGIY